MFYHVFLCNVCKPNHVAYQVTAEYPALLCHDQLMFIRTNRAVADKKRLSLISVLHCLHTSASADSIRLFVLLSGRL